MNFRWNFKNIIDNSEVEELITSINVESYHGHLLNQRQIYNFDQAKSYFRPQLGSLHNPFLMKDMDKAVSRIQQAIANNERILIYGDYDVDGTTAVAMTFLFLKKLYQHLQLNPYYLLSFYIPDRYKEGYGISIDSIDYAAKNNFSLVIALDCGIKAMDKIAYANSKSIDFIICDHHTVGDTVPDAIAILDPKQHNCNYPFKELSGNGVGFKLCEALCESFHFDKQNLYELLDLCAISIAADIVPVVNENRILAFYGLQRINQNPRPGIKAILDASNVKKELSISDCVFIIGPRINAAGRIDQGSNAVKLLIADNHEEAQKYSSLIQKNNTERQGLDKVITQEALNMLANDSSTPLKKSTVLYNQAWHKGVVGIVASRLTEKYYRPTIILTNSNGLATGSARSVKDFDVYEAIAACSDLLEQFGGHKYAAGLTLKTDNVMAFTQKFESIVNDSIQEYMLTHEIEIDLCIDFAEITPKFIRILKQFAPFGPGNMNPIFVTRNVKDNGWARLIKDSHIKLDLSQQISPSISLKGIGFGLGHKLEVIQQQVPFDVAYIIEENDYNGQKTLQLNIKDIRISEN